MAAGAAVEEAMPHVVMGAAATLGVTRAVRTPAGLPIMAEQDGLHEWDVQDGWAGIRPISAGRDM